VLHSDSASLGGRVLKYDSGETALQVSGWGAVTLYTDTDPAGLPAVRTGDFNAPVPSAVSVDEVHAAADENAKELAALHQIPVSFNADLSALAASAQARTVALDAMENVTRGIERFCRTAHRRNAFSRRITAVTLAMAAGPTVTLG